VGVNVYVLPGLNVGVAVGVKLRVFVGVGDEKQAGSCQVPGIEE